ncbi:MAG: glutamate synthase subunit beta [Gammaproteobacteria bacterium]|nr:glutamate synthase subunit beta [Gammaproteobacteria bacterium]
MGKPTGFKEFTRQTTPYRSAKTRMGDYGEIYTVADESLLKIQGARCMDCGVPFCHSDTGCPVDNLIPEWNDLVYNGRWREASMRLHATNNFPEFTGRVCPAPCEGSCVLGVIEPPVTIKNIEQAIVDRAFDERWVKVQRPEIRSGYEVAIIGSGPAGLAAAEQLNLAGHLVTVFERADRIGGLLMYGIPNMKLDKELINRRVQLMRDAGITFVVNADVGGEGEGSVDVNELIEAYDAVLFATGATQPRDLPIENRSLQGVEFAMDFLTANTRSYLDSHLEDGNYISAKDKNVVVIGGGDTGTDCIATALRHGCTSVVNFELMSEPPVKRAENNPWPEWPLILRTDYGHEEAIERDGDDPRCYNLLSKGFVGDDSGHVTAIKTVEVEWSKESGQWKMSEKAGTEKTWQTDLVLLSMGFVSPEHYISEASGVDLDQRGNYKADYDQYNTNVEKVFTAGDCRRGQSLVVWAINEGRGVAREIDRFLIGESDLP